jgi:hypothetical protein
MFKTSDGRITNKKKGINMKIIGKNTKISALFGIGLLAFGINAYADVYNNCADNEPDPGECAATLHCVCKQHIYNQSDSDWTVDFVFSGGGGNGHTHFDAKAHTKLTLMYCGDPSGYYSNKVLITDKNGNTGGEGSIDTVGHQNHCPQILNEGNTPPVDMNRYPGGGMANGDITINGDNW